MRKMAALCLVGLLACEDEQKTEDSAAAAGPTWHTDIEPLVQKSCATCHGGGGVGGIELTDYATASRYASAMATATASGLMPPPAMDPTCRPYQGDERMTLTDDEIALIGAWAEAGAPEGDPALAPAPVEWGTKITDPDLVLEMPFDHTVQPDADGNEYFCAILENPLTEAVYITGLDVEVGDAAVAHHMILAVDSSGDAGLEYGDDDPSDGFDCRDPIMEDDWEMVHAWAPGMDATYFPEGKGMKIEPGSQLVLQMHYFQSDTETHVDRSKYLLRVATEVDTEIMLYPIGPYGYTIPAGDAEYSRSDSFKNTYLPINVYGMFPHIHLLGKRYDAHVERADGGEECLARGEYDFDHQAFYMYDEPFTFEIGDTLTGGCTWDNSADNPNQYNDPPQDVSYGEGTNQEMCFFLIYLSG